MVRSDGPIDGTKIRPSFGIHVNSGRGRPAPRSRLVAGKPYRQHTLGASDEAVASIWIEEAYRQRC